MKFGNQLTTVLLAAGLAATSVLAEHEDHHQADQPKADAPKPEKTAGMGGGMMAEMPQMMARHSEISKLVDQVVTSFAAIQAENDPSALKKELEAHAVLLKELQTKVQAEGRMTEMMKQMMSGSMAPKPSDPTATPAEHQH